MAATYTATQAANMIGQLFDRASRGETITITRYGRAIAVIAPPAGGTYERIYAALVAKGMPADQAADAARAAQEQVEAMDTHNN